MNVDKPRLGKTSSMNQSKLLTLTSLARAAGVARGTVVRQLAQRILIPDGSLAYGNTDVPTFLPSKALEVLKNTRVPPRRGAIKKTP